MNQEKRQQGRTKLQKAEHAAREAELYNRGWTLAKIASDVGLSITTVFKDLKAIQDEWLKESLGDFDQAKARELAKIDWLEREAIEAWIASKAESVVSTLRTTTVGHGIAKRDQSIKKIKRTGNADYLATVQWCIEARCKIRGFFAPIKLDVAELDRILDQAVKDEVAAKMAAGVISELKM
jgi:hypothetical protein